MVKDDWIDVCMYDGLIGMYVFMYIKVHVKKDLLGYKKKFYVLLNPKEEKKRMK